MFPVEMNRIVYSNKMFNSFFSRFFNIFQLKEVVICRSIQLGSNETLRIRICEQTQTRESTHMRAARKKIARKRISPANTRYQLEGMAYFEFIQ